MSIALDNKQQAVEFRDYIADKIDDLMETALDDTFFALSAVRAAVVRDINMRVAQLPALLVYEPPETAPALVVAHDLYYDATREDEIISRNTARHPGFLPGGRDVEYLK